MRGWRTALGALVLQCCVAVQVMAGEFAWLNELDTHAQADPSGYRALLSERFGLGDADMQSVLNNVERPSEAYMILRLGEMSSQQSFYVTHLYHFNKGWERLANKLGVNPDSGAFTMLKAGHDLQISAGTSQSLSQHARRDDGNSERAGLN